MPPKCELFVVRDDQGPILYAPLRHLSARLNESAVAAVGRRLNGSVLSEEEKSCLEILEKCSFFEPAEVPEAPMLPPTEVTLFPTDGCNLRCRYCYAGAAARRHLMPPEVGKAAIDYVVRNAKEQGASDFVVAFHGNGEPFTAFPLVRELCQYACEAGEKNGLKPRLSAATNGVLNEEQLDWLLAWFDGVNISFDGLEELQNRERPMADGSGSFPYVHRTLKRLNEAGKQFGIRATLTADGVDRLPEIAAFVLENYPGCDPLHVEPAWEAGRGLETGERMPDPDRFIEKFLEAEELLSGKMRLVFSAARTDTLSPSFCGVCRDSFVVTSEGIVTSCYEVCEERDPRSSRYLYGKYDVNKAAFVFDEDRRADLHTLRVDRMPYCENCFCKYHCSGDCAAKLLGLKAPADHTGSSRCRITRALTLRQIQRTLSEQEGPKHE